MTVIKVADPSDEEIFLSAGIRTFSERKLPVAVPPAIRVTPRITSTVRVSIVRSTSIVPTSLSKGMFSFLPSAAHFATSPSLGKIMFAK